MSEARVFARKVGLVLAACIVVLLALYVWPGFWRYEFSRAYGQFFMVDRLTHQTYYRDNDSYGWVEQ